MKIPTQDEIEAALAVLRGMPDREAAISGRRMIEACRTSPELQRRLISAAVDAATLLQLSDLYPLEAVLEGVLAVGLSYGLQVGEARCVAMVRETDDE